MVCISEFLISNIVTSDIGYTADIKNGMVFVGDKITVELYGDVGYQKQGDLDCESGGSANVSLLQFVNV